MLPFPFSSWAVCNGKGKSVFIFSLMGYTPGFSIANLGKQKQLQVIFILHNNLLIQNRLVAETEEFLKAPRTVSGTSHVFK